jgi:hypothetical protein
MSDLQTVLGLLMQYEADQNQPSDDQREASWTRISEAIDEIERQRQTEQNPAPHVNVPIPVPDQDWNPKTAFNTRSMPRSVWRFPTRRLVFTMFAIFFGVAAILASTLYLQSSGILPGPNPLVTLPDDLIPLSDPESNLPTKSDLLVFLSEPQSDLLISLSDLPLNEQKLELERLFARINVTLVRSDPLTKSGTVYWTGQKPANLTDRVLVFIVREANEQHSWGFVYQIFPTANAQPSIQDLDKIFTILIVKREA